MIKICVIGLGYVGLPVALGVAGRFNTIGFDSNQKRIKVLKNKIKRNDIIVLESTVYPGLTNIFSNKLSNLTGLENNVDFFTCYSPERINPGDKSKKLSNIEKIFAIKTSNRNILNDVKSVYKLISKKIIFSKHISEAETAKAIENTQRDLNIALFNELLILSDKLKLNFNEIIRLASTKWNFLKFKPGLVGGHCLPVDPYYLSHIAGKNNFKMQVALAGRSMNNSMQNFVLNKFNQITKKRSVKNNSTILIVGLSYKYGVSDLRNSLNLEIFNKIKSKFPKAIFYDPFVSKTSSLNKNLLRSINMIIFLSEGKSFTKLYKKIKFNKKITVLDPFRYYQNI